MSDTLKLGEIIRDGRVAERDAIHVAVIPCVAAENLNSGTHVRLIKGEASAWVAYGDGAVGVVDPFLAESVSKGECFWLFLYPGTITSLRHDWTHPAFEHPAQKAAKAPSGPAWRTPTVLGIISQLRESMKEHQEWEDGAHKALEGAPVLADALEEAGYVDWETLQALRKGPEKYKGMDHYDHYSHRKAIEPILDKIEDDGSPAFSEAWLRRYAAEHNSYDSPQAGFERLTEGLENNSLFFHGSDLHSLGELDSPDELREHARRYLGVDIQDGWGGFTFECSC